MTNYLHLFSVCSKIYSCIKILFGINSDTQIVGLTKSLTLTSMHFPLNEFSKKDFPVINLVKSNKTA